MNETSRMDHAEPPEQTVKVWLVDDNNQLRSLIAETLERQERITCTRQFDSPNGLLSTLASRTGPDVILLDVQMGELNGLDALPAIKSLARETRVFMLTTFFDPGWHQRAMESGASGYYLKGDSLDKLLESIRDRSCVGAPVWRRRRRPICCTAEPSTLGTANTNLNPAEVDEPKAWKRVLSSWFKRFAGA